MEVRDKNKKQSRNGTVSVLPTSSTTRKPKSCHNTKKPSSLNSTKKPFSLPQSQSGKKPTSKTSQRSKLSATSSGSQRNPACGSGRGEPSDFNFIVPDSLVGFGNFTPVGKLLPWSHLNNVDLDLSSSSANVTDESKATTPPVEVSVSPEIQGGGGLYTDVAIYSTATPVCYGAGHLISGVTDKRKCRSRGILTVRGPSDSLGFSENDEDVVLKSRNSLIPLPAEASLDWLLSPLDKEGDVQTCDFSDSDSWPLGGLFPIPSPSLSSSLCRISSDFPSDDHGSSDALESTGKTRIPPLTPRRVSICEDILESLPQEKDVDFSATPESKSKGCLAGKGSCSYKFMGDKSPASTGPLSRSNVVQTLSSNTSSESRGCHSWIDAYEDQFSPDRVIVEQDYQMSIWDPPVLGPQSDHSASPSSLTDVIKLEKQMNGCASWVSDSTLESISLSQMRISWREGSASETFDMDDFDCCRCLSDVEDNGEGSGGFKHDSLQDFGKDDADPLKNEGLRSPEFLEKEPEYFRKEKKFSSPPNISAESISTDASGLMTSRDSDWTPYNGNQSFQVHGISFSISTLGSKDKPREHMFLQLSCDNTTETR